jgi:hypothetical protein
VLFAVAIAVFVGGLLLPEEYEISRRLVLSRTPEAAWQALTDTASLRRWRKDLMQLQPLSTDGHLPIWREIADDGSGTDVRTLDATPPVHLVLERVGERRRGTVEWEYTIARAPEGVSVALVERGRITNPIQRFLVQFLAGTRGRLDRHLAALAAWFDEPARID